MTISLSLVLAFFLLASLTAVAIITWMFVNFKDETPHLNNKNK